MKHAKHIAACLVITTAGTASAQFPLVNTSPSMLHTIRSLDSGLRYIDRMDVQAQERTIYDLDLTVFRVLNIPDPPDEMTWGAMRYITEALFDTDPSTIEYMISAYGGGGTTFAVFVFREDGTQLFTQDPGTVLGSGAGAWLNRFDPIFTVDDQTYLVVHQNTWETSHTNIYALPGSLPCIDCFGSPGASNLGVGEGPVMDAASGIRMFPNPAREQITVALGRLHSGTIMVRLYDGQGRLALEQPFAAAEQVEVNVGALAQGAYVCQVFVGEQLLTSLPVVVQR